MGSPRGPAAAHTSASPPGSGQGPGQDPNLRPGMATSDTAAKAPALWLCALLGLCAAAAVTYLARSIAHPVLWDDGAYLLAKLGQAEHSPPIYYHALYLPLAWLLRETANLGTASALLWASAVSAGLGAGLLVAAVWRWAAPAARLPLALAVLGCAGLWVHATLIELHATQYLGAVVLVLAALASPRLGEAPRLVLLALAAAFAVTSHNSSLALLPGAAWIASARPTGFPWPRPRALAVALLGLGLGGAVGWYVNGLSPVPEDILGEHTSQFQYVLFLLTDFRSDLTVRHALFEFLLPWAPCFLAPLLFARRGWRRALPIALAPLPLASLFLVLAIETRGGYFGPTAVFLVVAAAVGSRAGGAAPRFAPLAILAAVVLAAFGTTRDPLYRSYLESAAESAERRRAVAQFLPQGGVLLSVERDGQQLLVSHVAEISLVELVRQMGEANLTPKQAGVSLRQAVQVWGLTELPLLLDAHWHELADKGEREARYVDQLAQVLAEVYVLDPVEAHGLSFYRLLPRAALEGLGD